MIGKLGRTKSGFTFMVLTEEEAMQEIEKTRAFNKKVWKLCLDDAQDLLPENEHLREQLAVAMFERLAISSFSMMQTRLGVEFQKA